MSLLIPNKEQVDFENPKIKKLMENITTRVLMVVEKSKANRKQEIKSKKIMESSVGP